VFFLLGFSVLRVFFVLSFSNFFLVWLALELGTFSVVPILFLRGTSRRVEASLKYFVVRIVAALVFLVGAFGKKFLTGCWGYVFRGEGYSVYLFFIPLVVKIGLAPFHFWFPEVVQGVGFLQGLLVSTWQKISPIYLCCVVGERLGYLTLFLGRFSVLVGGWGGLNQTQVRKIMGFSSISFMGWVFCGVRFGVHVVFLLFILYVFVSTGLFLVFKSCRFFSLSMVGKFSGFPVFIGLLVCGILSLSGLPPFGGFLVKVVPIGLVIFRDSLVYLSLLIPGALLSLFFYLRLLFNVGFLIPPVSLGRLSIFRFDFVGFIGSFVVGWFFSISVFGLLYLGLVFEVIFN